MPENIIEMKSNRDRIREIRRNFNSVSLYGLLGGLAALGAGYLTDGEAIKGIGYGILIADATMNIVYRELNRNLWRERK